MENQILVGAFAIGLGFFVYKAFRFFESFTSATKRAAKLVCRNQNIIASRLAMLSGDGESYYVENQVRDCIAEIAKREGRARLVPRDREWLSDWEGRADIPADWQMLKNHIKEHFQKQHSKLVSLRMTEEAEQTTLRRREVVANNHDLIDKFLEIAERKVSVLDEYGEENWDALPQEIETCLTKIAKRDGVDLHESGKGLFSQVRSVFGRPELEWLRGRLEVGFREYHDRLKARPADKININGLSGIEFESWIAKALKERGFEVSGTPVTGDQGADLIAKRNGRTIIIQAKRYQGSVGNKAVQEVIGALAYYGGDEAWVVTSGAFTPSAQALAQKSRVRLIDGAALKTGGAALNSVAWAPLKGAMGRAKANS